MLLAFFTVSVGANTVILVSDNSADYATALQLAEALNATVITTEWGIYNESVVSEILNLSPDKVIVVGGPLAVVNNYTTELENNNIEVIRVGGQDRYQTNGLVLEQFKNQIRERFNNTACVCHGFDEVALNESVSFIKNGSLVVLTNGINLSVNPTELNITKVVVVDNPVCPFCNYTKLAKRLQERFRIQVQVKEINQNRIKIMLQNRLRVLERKMIMLKRRGIDVSDLEQKINEVKQLIEQNKLEEAYKIMVQLEEQSMVKVRLHLHPMPGRMMNNTNRGGPHHIMNHTVARGKMFVNSNGTIDVRGLRNDINTMPYQTINEEEKEGLLHMYEEEKLARDVYLTLYNKWKLPIFENIANAEKTHMAAVESILIKYNISYPKDEGVGKFNNSELQELYYKLVSEGNKSVVDALKVGCTIEDLDIYDLQQWINKTDNADIKTVYENLMKGSRNHMRAFYKLLVQYGGNYTPQYISQEEFNEIVNSEIERGPASGNVGIGGQRGFSKAMQ